MTVASTEIESEPRLDADPGSRFGSDSISVQIGYIWGIPMIGVAPNGVAGLSIAVAHGAEDC